MSEDDIHVTREYWEEITGLLRAAMGKELWTRYENGNATEDEKAQIDALLTGQGYLVDGRRVAPHRVEVIRRGG